MAICGAKTRSGQPCKRRPTKGKTRCKMHGGTNPGAPKGNKNNRIHGIYSVGLTDEEIPIFDQVELGTVDAELRMTKIRLRRALRAELTDTELELIERTESPSMPGGLPDYDEMVKQEVLKRRDYAPVIDRLMGRIESLEKTRRELMNSGGGDGGLEKALADLIEKLPS